jgi:HAD superfamily phosphoserine phosphatase-like hydrolase
VRNDTFYTFDLDGTVSMEELLPLMARELDLEMELGLLTRLTLDGTLSFEASFRLRFHILRSIPVETVQRISAGVPLHPAIEAFITANRKRCAVVTGNLDVWARPFIERLGCAFHTSTSAIENGQLTLKTVLDKGEAIRGIARTHKRIVAVGDSFNDMSMFEEADIGVAYGGVHDPVQQLVRTADYVVYDGDALCRLLNTL